MHTILSSMTSTGIQWKGHRLPGAFFASPLSYLDSLQSRTRQRPALFRLAVSLGTALR